VSDVLPLILGSHIALAIGLILPSLLLPFALRRGTPGDGAGRTTRGLLWLQAHGTIVFGFGLAATGILLVVAIGPTVLARPWLAVALVIYATNLVLAFFIQRPNLRRLLGASDMADPAEEARWQARARRQRYVSYVMALAVGLIAFLMSTKPELW
jgi:uncharacterized membrane protein